MATVGKIRYDIDAKTANFTSAMNRVDQRLGGMSKTVKSMGGILAGAFAVGAVAAFSKEVFTLAENAVEVKNAFDRLNAPGLLDNLRAATQGSVSDLELMKKAVSANNLGIPLEKMATLFEFATKRASETGESVDMLVNSIVTGIGRKSSLVLDNLGIVMSTAGKTVGEVADEVVQLAERDLVKMGEVGVNTGDQLTAAFENLKVTLGEIILGPGSTFTLWLTTIIEKVDELVKKIDDAFLSDFVSATVEELGRVSEKLFELQHNEFTSNPFLAKQFDDLTKKAANLREELARLGYSPLGFKLDPGGGGGTTGGGEADIAGILGGPGAVVGAGRSKGIDMSGFGNLEAPSVENLIDLYGELLDKRFQNLEALKTSVDFTKETVSASEEWQMGLSGVSNLLASINSALTLAGVKQQGLGKALMALLAVSQLVSSVAGAVSGFGNIFGGGVSKAVGGGPALGSAFKLRGQDLVGSVKTTTAIGSNLGVI